MTGSWRRPKPPARNLPSRLAPLTACLLLCPAVAAGAPNAHVVLPATTLDHALTLLGRQSGADIVSLDGDLGRVATRRVSGDMSAGDALRRLLRGTGFRAVRVGDHGFRVVRDGPPPAPVRRPPRPMPPPEAPDIVVTASKQRVPLLRYPGSLSLIGTATAPTLAPQDLTALSRVAPVLQSTAFGAGRDKVFIRGIADSSFVGAAQATASVYFGDVQLGFSGADPALRLYDMASVEVLEGPQGTLYGAGAIGGVIRLTPNPVDLARASGAIAAGAALTARGGAGFDLDATLNLPLKADLIGARGVLYRVRDGGFVDDAGRGARDVNRIDTTGGRLAVRMEPGDGWQVDVSGLAQRIRAADADYAERSAGPLARRAAVAQPFANDVLLARIVATKRWDGGLQLLSATGLAVAHADDLFDASRRPAVTAQPIVYRTQGSKRLFSHEMRLSRSSASGASWVAGLAVLGNRDSQNRLLGARSGPGDIIGVTNRTRDVSLFAEGTVPLRSDIAATLGVRGTVARTDGEPSFRPRSGDVVRGRSTRRLDPTAALSWRVAPDLALFGRIQSGYRTGGLAVARGVGRVNDFRADSILVEELGVRRLRRGSTGLALTAAASHARWTNIQADLVTRRGLPFTDNIGDARIETLEGTADWVPIRGLATTLAFLYTHNVVRGPLADTSVAANRRLPDTPAFAASGSVRYDWTTRRGDGLGVGATASYTGRSVLGTGDYLDVAQGRYAVLSTTARWTRRATTVSLTVDNVTDERGNRFASGNPLTLTARDQTTPLRPTNARIGVATRF